MALVQAGMPALTAYFLVAVLAYPVSLVAAVLIRRIPLLAFLFGAKPVFRLVPGNG